LRPDCAGLNVGLRKNRDQAGLFHWQLIRLERRLPSRASTESRRAATVRSPRRRAQAGLATGKTICQIGRRRRQPTAGPPPAPQSTAPSRRRRFTNLLLQTEQRGAPIVGKTLSNRERRFVVTETRRRKLHKYKPSDDGADNPACSILRKSHARMCPARGIRCTGAARSCHG
jgi:hypothetical protein